MELKGSCIQDIQYRVSRHLPTAHEVHLALGRCHLKIKTNSKELCDGLEAYFQEFLWGEPEVQMEICLHEIPEVTTSHSLAAKDPEPGKRGIKEAWLDFSDGRMVKKLRTGLFFLFGYGVNLAVGPCCKHFSQVVNFINSRCMEAPLGRGGLLGHASAVSIEKKGVAIAGVSGAGKSTLALHLMTEGADFISNDKVILEKMGDRIQLLGFAKHPRVNPGTLLAVPGLLSLLSEKERKRYGALLEDELRSLERKSDVIIHEVYGRQRFLLEAPLRCLVILNWSKDEEPTRLSSPSPLECMGLMGTLMKSPGLFYCPGDHEPLIKPHPESYLDCLSNTPVYEISGTMDFHLAARMCLEAVKSVE